MKHIISMILLSFSLAACSSAGGNGAVTAVESYLQAKVSGDADTITALLCSEMERDLQREIASFSSVTDARIDGMACTAAENVVTCEGTIVATYGLNEETFPLTRYNVVQEDGEWRWCGEARD